MTVEDVALKINMVANRIKNQYRKETFTFPLKLNSIYRGESYSIRASQFYFIIKIAHLFYFYIDKRRFGSCSIAIEFIMKKKHTFAKICVS